MSRYYYSVNLLLDCKSKGFVPLDSIPDSIQDMYSILKGFRRKRCRDLKYKSYISEQVISLLRGTQPAKECFHALSR
jgi:hypothetical protein